MSDRRAATPDLSPDPSSGADPGPQPPPDPEALLAAWQAGTAGAAARLFEGCARIAHDAIARFLAFRCRGRLDLAEDLTHDLFLALFRDDGHKLRQFQGRNGCSFAGWLRVVAVRFAIDALRRERQPRSLDEDSPAMLELQRTLASEEPDPQLAAEGSEAAARLAAAVERLGTKDRLLVELHIVRGGTLEDVASVLGVTMNAAYVRKSRVLERLRRSLGGAG